MLIWSLLFLILFQVPNQNQDKPTFKTGIEMVHLRVSVTDNKKRPVSNLKREDFVVYENGRRQEISIFQGEATPISLTLLIDSSGSMVTVKPISQIATLDLITQLKPEDKISIAAFSSYVLFLQDFTTNKKLAIRTIDDIVLWGETAIYDAVYAISKLQPSPDTGVNVVILLTDGKDTASKIDPTVAADTVRITNTVIYVVKLGNLKISSRDKTFLEIITRETGGQLYSVKENLNQVRKTYSQIATDIANQYTVGYISNNTSSSDYWHTISVTIPEHPKYQIRHRKGYYKG